MMFRKIQLFALQIISGYISASLKTSRAFPGLTGYFFAQKLINAELRVLVRARTPLDVRNDNSAIFISFKHQGGYHE